MKSEKHPFEPIIFSDSHTLILGSFPSIKSFELGFYYAHPRNQFWPLLGQLFNEKVQSISERITLCQKHHIALWDVAHSLTRSASNSSDTNLSEIVVHDFETFLAHHPTITKVLFTGKKAAALFQKHYKHLSIDQATLPSPSPAYAAMSMQRKLEIYKKHLA